MPSVVPITQRERENRRASNRFVVSDSRASSFKTSFPRSNRTSFLFNFRGEKGGEIEKKEEEERNEARQSWSEVRLERIMRTNANAVGSERTFICHAVADVHDNRDGRIVVRTVRAVSAFLRTAHTFQTFDPFHGMSSPPPSLVRLRSLRPFPSRSNFHRPGRRPCTLPRLSATVISLPPSYTLLFALSVAFLLIIQLYSTFFND